MTTSTAQADKQKVWDEMEAAEVKGATPVEQKEEDAKPASEVVAEVAAAPATAPEAAPEKPAEDDPYAGLHPVVKDEIRGMRSMLEGYQQQLRSVHGHIGGMTSQIKSMKEAQGSVKAQGGTAPTTAQLQEAQGDSSAMARLKADYPEFGAALDAALEERLKNVQDKLATAKPAEGDEQPMTRRDFADLLIEERHAGWKNEVKTPAFRGWLEGQPTDVKALGASASPHDAIRLLDLHKQARGQGPKKEDQARLDAAAAIPMGRTPSTPRAKPIDQMTKAEYWAYLDEQDRQTAYAGR